MRVAFASVVLSLGLAQAGFAQTADMPQGNVEISVIRTERPTVFRVELHNPGGEALVLNVGMALANGSRQYIDRVHLALTMPDGKVLHLEPMGPGFIAGRVDPLIVPLPAGATFAFPVDLQSYVAPKADVWRVDFAAGTYSLQAEYAGAGVSSSEANLDVKGIALMPFWKGEVVSSPVEFTVPQDHRSTVRALP